VVSRGIVLESPAITGEVPKQQLPKKYRVPETPSYQSGRASDRPVAAFKRCCPGEAQRSGKSRSDGGPRTRRTRNSAEDIGSDASRHHRQRDKSKNLAGPSGTNQGTGIASKGVALKSKDCSP